jgi:fido (protein-threonine AMPylation protein)
MRLEPPLAAKEKRLQALLERTGRGAGDPSLSAVVEDAQILGSLELAGERVSWSDVRGSRSGAKAPAAVAALRLAHAAVAPAAAFSVDALRAWHAAIAGPQGFRSLACPRDDAPTAPPAAIEDRLETLAEWLSSPGIRDLKPEQAAGLAYARIVEIRPFADGNGRVARLAASQLMVRAGLRPPILVGADAAYLRACLRAAFRLDTEPLVSLLAEASARALDVMIQAIERGEA